jgi:hypothetical protein
LELLLGSTVATCFRGMTVRGRGLYSDNAKRVFPRRKFVEVDSERDDLFSGYWI